jgi:hypothetical protein
MANRDQAVTGVAKPCVSTAGNFSEQIITQALERRVTLEISLRFAILREFRNPQLAKLDLLI